MKHIHISVEDMDGPDGFTGTDCVAYVDGVVDGSVIEMNTEEGWVRCMVFEDLGNDTYRTVFNEDGSPKEILRYGKVTVQAIDEFGRQAWYGVEE